MISRFCYADSFIVGIMGISLIFEWIIKTEKW